MLSASATAALGGAPLRTVLCALPRLAGALAGAAAAPRRPLPGPAARPFTSDGANGKGAAKHSALYITDAVGATVQEHTPLLLGMLNYFERHLPYVGYFTPFGGAAAGKASALPTDAHVKLMQSVFGGDFGCAPRELSMGLHGRRMGPRMAPHGQSGGRQAPDAPARHRPGSRV